VRTMSYSQARQNLASTFDAVINDCEEIVVTRAGHEPVVIVSLAEYESLKETAYLLGTPANARRLYEAIEAIQAGRTIERDLIE
jgi:antitoxin YefM